MTSSAIIGAQTHHGNRWYNLNSVATASNSNGIGIAMSIIKIHTVNLPFWPQLISPIAGWFLPDPGATPFDCVQSNSCMAFIDDPDPEDQARIATDRLIALDSIQFVNYNDEMLAVVRSRLFESIRSDTSLYLTDPIFTNFYLDLLGSPSGEISNVGEQLAESISLDSTSYYTLSTTNTLINALLDSIIYVDSVNIINPDPAYDLLRIQYTQQINNLRNVANSILSLHALNAGLIWDSLLLINSAIQPTELPDINRHSIYEILGEYYEIGDAAIYTHLNTILSIAHQCPFAGGPDVYTARGLVRVVNDSVEYFDDIICLQAGYYREMSNVRKAEQAIKLMPNPTSSFVDVFAINMNENQEPIEIYNNVGELVYSDLTEIGNVLIKRIDVSNLNSGFYSLRVQKNGLLYQEKLVIIK